MLKHEPDIFIYKVVADTGGAPCVTVDLLSLAICKPTIRKSAEKGSLIFGFGGKNYEERLLYIARITEKPEVGDYYRTGDYAKRADCIYREVDGKAVRKRTARYHVDTDHRRKDVGLHFEHAFVLLSRDFRYFGRKGTAAYKERFPQIREMIQGLTRGHRRYHSPALRKQLLVLQQEVWRRNRRLKIGLPTERNPGLRCNADSPSGRC